MSTVEPERITVTRHRCPFCRKSWSTKRTAVEHVQRCWYNPANRSCKTCTHFVHSSPDCGEHGCNGCGNDEYCGVGVELHPVDRSLDDILSGTAEPDRGLPLNCPQWKATR